MTNNQEIIMATDRLDDDSVVVNFDIYDEDEGQAIKGGGYVHVRQDNAANCFTVTVYDADGNVLSETLLPFNFTEY
jgi:hypothetical protein